MKSSVLSILTLITGLISGASAFSQDASWDSHLILIRLDNMASFRIERSHGKNDPGRNFCLRITSLVRPDETRMISVKGISPVPVRLFIEPGSSVQPGMDPLTGTNGLPLTSFDQVCIADLKSCYTSKEDKNTIIIRVLPDPPGLLAPFSFCQVIYTLYTN